MSTYFPQINSDLIITQLPYSIEQSFETVQVPVETGMRWSFPRRGNVDLSGYSTGSLRKFSVNFTSITDAEVGVLRTFFRSMGGRLHAFRFLDPGGNLLADSSNLGDLDAWAAVNVVYYGKSTDPYGHNLASIVGGISSSGSISSLIGPSDGGLSGFVVNVSAWVYSTTIGTMSIGVSGVSSSSHGLPSGRWVRISHSCTINTNSPCNFILSSSDWTSGRLLYVYCPQVSPMKGEGAGVQSPGGYGYHPNCRFDVDSFEVNYLGPNQASVSLPIAEFNV